MHLKPRPARGVMLSQEDYTAWQWVLHRFMQRPVPDLGGLSALSDRRDYLNMYAREYEKARAGPSERWEDHRALWFPSLWGYGE